MTIVKLSDKNGNILNMYKIFLFDKKGHTLGNKSYLKKYTGEHKKFQPLYTINI